MPYSAAVVELKISLVNAEAEHAEFKRLIQRDYNARMATMAEDEELTDHDAEAARHNRFAKNLQAAERMNANARKRRALEKKPPRRT